MPNWIQKADMKKGKLHHVLGIPMDQHIPVGLLNEIRATEVGGHVHGPHGWVPVTGKLKKEANLARTLRRM